MSPHVSLNRRDFIKVTSVAGAGLVIGFTLPAALKKIGAAAASDGRFTPNAWLRIDPDGSVTVTVAKSEMGQGVQTALPMIVAEELDADWSSIRIEQAIADARYGHMGTGGSTSVRTSWEPLRRAGALARQMLVTAAAQTWNVKTASCRTESGKVIHTPTNRVLRYGELVATAAELPVPTDVTLKDPKDFRIVGKRTLRLDVPGKVDGSAQFGIDVKVPGMLYASVARCPVFGGKVQSFNAAKALAVSGVRRVVQVPSGIAVIAESTWTAMSGRDALEITWDEGSAATLTSAKIHDMLATGIEKPGAVAEESGDVAGALKGAAKKIEATYEVPFLAHATMEPMNCVADVRSDRCEVWAPTQNPQAAQQEAASITGLDESKVNVHTTLMGGGFGRRLNADFVSEAVQVSEAAGAPVKVTWSREDDMHHDWYRPASMHHLTGALDANGTLIAFTHRIVAPSIAGQRNPDSVKGGLDHGAVEGAVKMPYDIPNVRIDYVMTNTAVPAGPWRAVYPTQNVFAMECFIDELARAAGQDPIKFRTRMMGKAPRMKGVLELAAEKAGWGNGLPKGHFLGAACSPPAFYGSYAAEVAEVSVNADRTVRVHRFVCAVDCGPVVNPLTVEAQIEGGIVYGLSAALKGAITIDKGRVVQGSWDDYPILTIDEMPAIDVHIVKSTEPLGGIGEPPVPASFPAVANAVAAATGKPVRVLPIRLVA